MDNDKPQPRTGVCGHPVSSNDMCSVRNCWNNSSNRYNGVGR
jgi:hypothetical protein